MPATVLVPVPTLAPSTAPLIVVPDTEMLRVYQVPVATVRLTAPSTETALPLTTWSCA